MLGRGCGKTRMIERMIFEMIKGDDRMFDIEILGYSFYFKHNNKEYPIVKIGARHEDDFLCMPIEFERVYDAYDWVYNWIDTFNDKALDDIIKKFVDELWKEFHKGIPKAYGIRIYITLPIRPNMWIKQHIDHEFKRCLAIKHDTDVLCRELSNSRFGIISHDMNHMYPVPIIPNRDIRTLDTDLADSIIDTLRYAQHDINEVVRAKEKIKEYEKMKIENVIFNDPATIVFWRDGSKTVVKAQNEPFDKEKGLAMAIAKKVYGNEGNYYNEFKKFIKEDAKEESEEKNE